MDKKVRDLLITIIYLPVSENPRPMEELDKMAIQIGYANDKKKPIACRIKYKHV